MAGNALRLEAQAFMREFRRFLGTREALPPQCQIDRPVPRASGSFVVPSLRAILLNMLFKQCNGDRLKAEEMQRLNRTGSDKSSKARERLGQASASKQRSDAARSAMFAVVRGPSPMPRSTYLRGALLRLPPLGQRCPSPPSR